MSTLLRRSWIRALELWIFGSLAFAQSRSSFPGTINGAIVTGAGVPVPAVMVSAVRIFPVGGTLADPPLVSAVSNSQGRYILVNVTPGSYKLCVAPQGLALLDPCLWSESPSFTNVRSLQITRLNIQLEQGSWLYVHVDDPDDDIGKKEKAKPNARPLTIGVRSVSGPVERLDQVSADAKGRNYRVAVPRGKNISLVVDSDDIAIEDRTGKAVDRNSSPAPVQLGSGSKTVELQVKKTPPGQK